MVSYSMNISNTRDRERGYLDAMAAAGLEQNTHIERVRHNSYDSIPEYVRNARKRGVDGFMIATNTLASLIIAELNKGRFRIPGDFQVACFDHNPLFDIYESGIIYASQPVDQFASKALEIVMSHIRTKPAETITPERVVLSSEINE